MGLTEKEYKLLCKSQRNGDWLFTYNMLIQFKHHYKRFPYNKEKYLGVAVGTFSNNQRSRYKKGTLQYWKYTLLDDIGFPFKINKTWDEMYDKVKKYKKEYPDKWPLIKRGTLPDYLELREWVLLQRIYYRQNKLSVQKIEKLDHIKFPWVLQKKSTWLVSYDKLSNFYDTKGKWPVHTSNNQHERYLENWGHHQRWLHKCKKLSADHLLLLKSIGFPLDYREAMWIIKYNAVKNWVKKNKRFPTKKTSKELDKWCLRQRDSMRKNTLSEKRIKLLDKIRFCWNPCV